MAVRAIDVRDLIKRHGTEKGVIIALEQICEELVGHRQNQRSMTEIIDRMANVIAEMVAVGDTLKQQITQMKRVQNQGVEVGSEPID